MVTLQVLFNRRLRTLPEILDVRFPVKRRQQPTQRLHGSDVRRNIHVALLDGECRRPAGCERERNVLAELERIVFLTVALEEVFDRR